MFEAMRGVGGLDFGACKRYKVNPNLTPTLLQLNASWGELGVKRCIGFGCVEGVCDASSSVGERDVGS